MNSKFVDQQKIICVCLNLPQEKILAYRIAAGVATAWAASKQQAIDPSSLYQTKKELHCICSAKLGWYKPLTAWLANSIHNGVAMK